MGTLNLYTGMSFCWEGGGGEGGPSAMLLPSCPTTILNKYSQGIGVRNPSSTQPLVKAKSAVGIAQKPFNLQSIYYYQRDGPRGHRPEPKAGFPRKTGRIRTDVQGWRSSLFRMMDQASPSELIRNTFVWWDAS
ncbi:hypothetical protein CEXT_516261 [Caerostris extrusa]|uniref:Uncharacterized protein n=1 Tax=Caerostris extrusa TaxID=172846 RepID=A0AAV4NCY2_CAEEX|nr:hypothetical protein CEXT_516261 [Caerostris extrusa]